MRTTHAATAALALALSGSLALGLSGTATAVTHHSPAATGATSAPQDADDAVRQIHTIRDLGRLAQLTGRLGRVAHDEHAGSALTRDVQKRVNRQVRQILESVEQDGPARTLPAFEDGNGNRSRPGSVTVSGASRSFQRSVQQVVNVGRGDAKSRTAATDRLLRRLSGVNAAAMNEIGMSPHVRQIARRSSSPRSAITTTLIDHDTLRPDSSDRFSRYDDVTDAISELIEDVYKSRDGRLSSAEAAGHSRDLNEALSALRHGTSKSDRSKADTRTLDDVEEHAEALLKAGRSGNARDVRAEARRLMGVTPKLLATMTGGSPSYVSWDMNDDADDADDRDDDELRWTGMILSPMVR
jgi:hypothetical protein